MAGKRFIELLLRLGEQRHGDKWHTCTHFAFTDGSKVGAEESDDGRPHVACGVFEGARLVADTGGHSVDDLTRAEPNEFRAYGHALPPDAEVPDAELAAILLFLGRCAAASRADAPVHAIVVIDSEGCAGDVERVIRMGDLRALAPRNRPATLEAIENDRRTVVGHGGSVRIMWCPAHIGIYGNMAADAVAKAFLYEPVQDALQREGLTIRRSLFVPQLRSSVGAGEAAGDEAFYDTPADRKMFRLVRKQLWDAAIQEALPPGLRRQQGRTAVRRGTPHGEAGGEEGPQWLGFWPILDPAALGMTRAATDPPRWQAVVEATSVGASSGEGSRTQLSPQGLRFIMRDGGVIFGLHGLACCPLCGLRGARLDLRHVLCGECTHGASDEQRAATAALLRAIEESLPLQEDEHREAKQHDGALRRELALAAEVFGTQGSIAPRGTLCEAEEGARDDAWWSAARLASGRLPAWPIHTSARRGPNAHPVDR